MSSAAKIVIVGAGLGGLTAALALIAKGFSVSVHEQAPALHEVGAGLTLSRGAQHVFRELGLMDRVAPFSCPVGRFPFLHYRTGRVLSGALDHREGRADDGTADIERQIHRADLHHVLATALEERAPGALHLGQALIGINETDTYVEAVFANGTRASGDALIAADGVRSAARALLWGADSPRFTGQIAYRFLVDRTKAAPFMGLGRGAVFLGPGCTFNRYTVRGGATVNAVAIVAHKQWTDDGWSTPATRDELLGVIGDWHQDVTGLVGQADAMIRWGLFDRKPLPQWARGRTTLLGDAAHAMLPFLGMGAAMAIEDGMILARTFAAESGVASAFSRYEAVRRPRTALVHASSVRQGELTQTADPDAYDATSAPASDPAITGYNPVTATI